jgi:SPRY domain
MVDQWHGVVMSVVKTVANQLAMARAGTMVPAVWDPVTATAVTLSGGNLVVTNIGTTSGDQGARVAATSGRTTSKYYFEITISTLVGAGGGNTGVGVATTASTYTGMGNNATSGAEVFTNNGGIYANGGSTGFTGLGAFASGNIIQVAIDLDNRKAWFKKTSGSQWNGMASHDPATNTGGGVIPAGTITPICTFGGSGGTTGNVFTANLGASAFVGTVPAGFMAGWPS